MTKNYSIPKIRALLNDGFTDDELRRLCYDVPAFKPVYNELASETGKAKIIDRLIEHAEQKELCDPLLAWAEKANPAKYQKYQPYYEPAPSPATDPDHDVKSRRAVIGNGLLALIELMQAPEVRDDVATFQAVFQATREQIGVLGDYKDLHDLLHRLQFHCHDRVRQNARNPLQDEFTQEDLEDCEIFLQDIVEHLWEIARSSSIASNEISWIKTLDQARQELHEAIETSDKEKLDRVVRRVHRVLAVQPSNINTRLNEAARALRLHALVEALTAIHGNLTQAELDPQKVRQFQNGVGALATLNRNLIALVDSHNRWQAVDNDLRLIDTSLEQRSFQVDLDEFEPWPSLKAMAEPLYSDRTEAWASELKVTGEKLDSAIATKNPDAAKKYFRSYHTRASHRFFRVDDNLRKLCGELRTVGEPLASIMGMIQ